MTCAQLIEHLGIFQLYKLEGRLILRGQINMIGENILMSMFEGKKEGSDVWSFDFIVFDGLRQIVIDAITDFEHDRMERYLHSF